MIQGIEHLPVMQLKTGATLPPNVQNVELARIRYVHHDGKTQRIVTRLETPIGRSPTGDVYYPIKGGGQEVVGCISAENIKYYSTLYKIQNLSKNSN